MKIKIYTHKLIADISDDLPKVVAYFAKHGITLDLDVQETIEVKGNALVNLMQPNDGKFDIVAYMYNRGDFTAISFGLAFNVSKTLRGIYLATSVLDDSVDYTWKSLCHEIMHCLFYKYDLHRSDPMDVFYRNGVPFRYYKNEELDAPDGNFAEAWKRLEPSLGKKYKYFSQRELDTHKLKPELWAKLDEARDYANTPFRLTSGLRSPSQNALVGGATNSSHLEGIACDISCTESTIRYRMITGLLKAGFTRIGIYSSHIHCDLRTDSVMWLSEKD